METLSVILIICVVLCIIYIYYIKTQYTLIDNKQKNFNNYDDMSFLSDNYERKKLSNLDL